MGVIRANEAPYQSHASLTSHAGATATTTLGEKLEGELSGAQLATNAFAVTYYRRSFGFADFFLYFFLFDVAFSLKRLLCSGR